MTMTEDQEYAIQDVIAAWLDINRPDAKGKIGPRGDELADSINKLIEAFPEITERTKKDLRESQRENFQPTE